MCPQPGHRCFRPGAGNKRPGAGYFRPRVKCRRSGHTCRRGYDCNLRSGARKLARADRYIWAKSMCRRSRDTWACRRKTRKTNHLACFFSQNRPQTAPTAPGATSLSPRPRLGNRAPHEFLRLKGPNDVTLQATDGADAVCPSRRAGLRNRWTFRPPVWALHLLGTRLDSGTLQCISSCDGKKVRQKVSAALPAETAGAQRVAAGTTERQ